MKVTCSLCFHHCALENGQTGYCRARGNRGGVIVPLNYGKISGIALDPIEKKPLRRFHPGSKILSVGSFGCNLRCPFCQNHEISMAGAEDAETLYLSPDALAEQAERLRELGNIGAAYTYNEPLIGYEYVRDCAGRVRGRGMLNVLVSNGTISAGPWRELLPLLDAVNLDLKGFTDAWYRRLGGDLETVKENIRIAAEAGCHVEVTTLLVTGENDTEEEINALSAWLASVNRLIPLHLSRFFPRYRMPDKPPTPLDTVYRLADTARKHLAFVYTGNC
ncbi:MAG: AmmeMemoRadiSam system radical SAM enzyme [Oscillibacter sp.]|nr:AmmeMemoRadiSam system radical SAM enzyme [Oscillibacter sp.]